VENLPAFPFLIELPSYTHVYLKKFSIYTFQMEFSVMLTDGIPSNSIGFLEGYGGHDGVDKTSSMTAMVSLMSLV
jgi:hypothetical protein